jgi:uncharacterized protein (TIRG00374 family)
MTPASARAARQLVGSIVIGVACLWFAFRGVRDGAAGEHLTLAALMDATRAVPAWSWLTFVGLFVLQALLRVERWRLQVRGLTSRNPAWGDSLTINGLAFAAVFFVPFRLGELLRPNLCASRGIMSASAGLAATALERVIDGMVATAMFGVLLLAAPFDWPVWARAGGASALFFFGGGIVVLVAAFKAREWTLTTVSRLVSLFSARLAERVVAMTDGFLDGLRCFRGSADVVLYVGLSVAYWILNALGTAAIVVGVDDDASVFSGFVCLCFLVIGVMLPAPPGNVGNFHAFAKLGLTVSGVGEVPAVVAAVLLHAISTVGVALIGVVSLAFGSFRWSDAQHALRRPSDERP